MTMTDRKLAELQKAYRAATRANERAKAIGERAGKQILTENEFYASEEMRDGEAKRITKHFNSFLMSDEDFAKYCKLHNERMRQLGLEVPEGFTDTFETQPALKAAEDALLEYGKQITVGRLGITEEEYTRLHNHWKARGEVLNLLERLVM